MIVASVDDDERERTIIVCVLEDENLERMRLADPMIVRPPMFHTPKFPTSIEIVLAYEAQSPEMARLVKIGDIGLLLKYITRGYKYEPAIDGKLV